MRDTIIKVVKIALACALVFLVAAPLIVGVYDAANSNRLSAYDGIAVSKSSIEVYTDRGFCDIELSNDGGVSAHSIGNLEQSEFNNERARSGSGTFRLQFSGECSADSKQVLRTAFDGGGNSEYQNVIEEVNYTVNDWYSGSTDIINLFESGVAHLVYEYEDGAIVDFGNPYILDWTDVSKPGDYDQVISDFEKSQLSIFAPEKAYAGVVGFALGKLKYLCAKALMPANKMLINLCLAGASVFGVTAAELPVLEARLVAATTPIMEVLSKDSPLYCEEGLAICGMDAVNTAMVRGASIAELPAIAQESAICMETTGTTLSGSSANFMTGVYQFLATNQVSAEFLMSNADFFTTFFSWLGADLTEYTDVSGGDPSSSIVLGDHVTIHVEGFRDAEFYMSDNLFPFVKIGGKDYGNLAVDDIWVACQTADCFLTSDSYTSPYRVIYTSTNITPGDRTYIFVTNPYQLSFTHKGDYLCYIYSQDYVAKGSGQVSSFFEQVNNSFGISQTVLNSQNNYEFRDSDTGYVYASYVDGVWSGDSAMVEPSGDGSLGFDGQIVGAGAQYDDAGNITDYGNVNVPNVYAPDYVAPGTYAEALNQMNATATTENPAHADSPSFGQDGTTVKDWTDANKPSDPAPAEGRDAFRIEDLETVFPFCIPWDIYYLLSQFAADPRAPSFTWHFDMAFVGQYDLAVDLADWEPVAQVLRACETVAFCVGLALLTRNLVRG